MSKFKEGEVVGIKGSEKIGSIRRIFEESKTVALKYPDGKFRVYYLTEIRKLTKKDKERFEFDIVKGF